MNNVIIQSSSSKRHHQRKLHQHHDNHKVYALLRKYNRDTSRVPHYTRGGMDSRAVAVEEPFVVMPIVVAAIREQAYSQSHTSSRACQRSCNSNRGMRSKACQSSQLAPWTYFQKRLVRGCHEAIITSWPRRPLQCVRHANGCRDGQLNAVFICDFMES